MPRPRSASSHKKVLDAALLLVSERGIEGTSMDAIAQASGVSKATIYKHWKDKDALLLEMMAEMAGLNSRPAFDSGNTRADVLAVLSYQPEENARLKERVMPHWIAYSARNPSFGSAWRHTVMEPPRRELRHLLKLGIEKGELSPKLDVELSLALLLGPMIYLHLFQKRPEQDRPVPRQDGTRTGKPATGGSKCQSPWVSRPANLHQIAAGVVDAFWLAFALKPHLSGAHATAPRTPATTSIRSDS
jgi:AcrR family transcriptional regulator